MCIHPCLCVYMFLCQGRSVVFALDSTCCYWTHWAQLAPVSVCVRVWQRTRKNERHRSSLCFCWLRLFVSLCIFFIVLCGSVSSYWQLFSAATVHTLSQVCAHTSIKRPLHKVRGLLAHYWGPQGWSPLLSFSIIQAVFTPAGRVHTYPKTLIKHTNTSKVFNNVEKEGTN